MQKCNFLYCFIIELNLAQKPSFLLMAENLILLIQGNSVSPGLKQFLFGKYLVNSGFLIPSPLTFPLGAIYVLVGVARRQYVWSESQPLTVLGTSD